LIDISKVGYVEDNIQLSDYKLQVGDILFSNINSVSHIGKTAFVDKDYDLYHGMNLLRLTAKSNILAKYLFYQLNTTILKKKFISICNQAVSQASINQTDLGKVTVHIPPLSEQYNIVKILDTLYLKLMIEQEINSRFQSQKQHLLSAMFI
jgi:type I restriction enzyme S subunit